MRKARGKRCVWGLCGVLAGVVMATSVARAEVITDQSGSVLIYPKIVWNGDRDTIVQLTHTRNEMMAHVRCFYVNAALLRPTQPPGPLNPRLWQVTDFELWLTKLQPTHWVVSEGRPVNFSDPFGSNNAGYDPGAIPPVPYGFEGDLTCVQVDGSGFPMGGNGLKGEAVIRAVDADVVKYNAYAIRATNIAAEEPDNELKLNNTPTFPGEYNSCPQTLLLNHYAENTINPQCRDGECAVPTTINTTLTLTPCSRDFEDLIPGKVTVFFEITNELEQRLSGSTTVECWLDLPLETFGSTTGMGPFVVLGPGALYTRIFPVGENRTIGGERVPDGGVIGIAEERNTAGRLMAEPFGSAAGLGIDGISVGGSSLAAFNIQQEGYRFDVVRDQTGREDIYDTINLSDQQ